MNKFLLLDNDEFRHATKVMRNKKGDKVFASDGKVKYLKELLKI